MAKYCIVVGGGNVAERKAKSLLQCGASLKVVSPVLGSDLRALYEQGKIDWVSRPYQPGDLAGAFLVIAATDDPNVQRQVFSEAEENNILVNVADVPERCNFILPANVRRGDFTISVSTAGKSPALARKLRQALQKQFGSEYGILVELLGALRPMVMDRGKTQPENKEMFERLLADDLAGWIRDGAWESISGHIHGVLGGDTDLAFLATIKDQIVHKTAGSEKR